MVASKTQDAKVHLVSSKVEPSTNTINSISRLEAIAVGISVLIALLLVGAQYHYVPTKVRHFSLHGNYCGPSNGRNFSLTPVDGLDSLCAQHDYCIEQLVHEKRKNGGHEEIPLRSHTNPKFGCAIMACDQQFVDVAATGNFFCSGSMGSHLKGVGLPVGKFCIDNGFKEKDLCEPHYEQVPINTTTIRSTVATMGSFIYNGVGLMRCKAMVYLSTIYHESKVWQTCNAIQQDDSGQLWECDCVIGDS